MAAVYNTISLEQLDQAWNQACAVLEDQPGNWDALEMQVVLENEYQRLGVKPPRVRGEIRKAA